MGFRKRIAFIFVLLLATGVPTLLPAALWWPWQKSAVNRNPTNKQQKMFLVHDLDGDRIPEGIILHSDGHDFRQPYLSICSLSRKGRKAVIKKRLKPIYPKGHFVESIRIQDIDGDRIPDTLIRTVSKDGAHRYLTVVRFIKKYKTFTHCKFNTKVNTLEANYSFTPQRGEHEPEVEVVSRAVRSHSIFSSIVPIRKIMPHFRLRQVFQLIKWDLKLYEQTFVSTPFYILDKFLRAIRTGKRFTAYKYISYTIPFPKFKTFAATTLKDLYNKEIKGKLELTNWYLEYFKKRRNFGWMTFRFTYPKDGKTRLVDFQVFMKKNWDEWKITLIRKIRIRTQ